MNVNSFFRLISIPAGVLLLSGLVWGLGSCRIVQPL